MEAVPQVIQVLELAVKNFTIILINMFKKVE